LVQLKLTVSLCQSYCIFLHHIIAELSPLRCHNSLLCHCSA